MFKWILSAVAVAALLVPLAVLADDAVPTTSAVASQICKAEQASMGVATFRQTYGTNASKSNAFGKCVAKSSSTAHQDIVNAAKSCKAERASDPTAFATKYGTSKGAANGKGTGANAFGKCVSLLAKQSANAQAKSASTAAATCKAALKADPSAFATAYGSDRNAFGKCVARKSTTK